MHSSKEQQNQTKQGDCAYGTDVAQLFLASLFGPAADMAMEATQVASTLYADRFETAAKKAGNRTNGHEGGFQLGTKNSLGGSFNSARTASAPAQKNMDFALPYWKRDTGYRLAA